MVGQVLRSKETRLRASAKADMRRSEQWSFVDHRYYVGRAEASGNVSVSRLVGVNCDEFAVSGAELLHLASRSCAALAVDKRHRGLCVGQQDVEQSCLC